MLALVAERRRQQSLPYVQGVSAQVPDGFDAGTLAECCSHLDGNMISAELGRFSLRSSLSLSNSWSNVSRLMRPASLRKA